MHSSLPNRAQSDRSTVVVHPVSSTAHNQSQVQVPPPLLSRLPRIPIGLFISILVVLCSVACGIIAFLVIYFPADSLAEKALRDFTDAVATVTAEKVQRRFDIFRSVAEDAVRVLGRTHAYTKLDANVNASLSYDGLGADVSPLPLSDTLLWFARTLDATGLILVLYHSLVDGLIISPYSIFDAVHFARRPGLITVANTTIASRTSFVESGYFRLDDFHPENTTQPFVRNYFNRYVVEARPYTPVFQESGFALRWSPIYVGVLQRTSSIGLGASWGTAGGTNVSARSTFGFHGYTADVVAFFQTLTIGKTGAAILIDVASRAFVGGNIADDSTRFVTTTMTNTTSNISTTTTTPQLVLMEELQDSRVAPVVNAAGFDAINESTGALVYGNRLLTCTFDHVDSNGINGPAANGTATACLFVFNPSTSILKEMDHFSFSLLTDEVQIIHVSAVQDEYGLDMRLILIIPTDDFVGSMRRGAVRSLAIASSVILFMVVIVACLSHVWLLNPLKDMAKVLKKAVGRNEPKETYKPRPVDGTRADTPPLSSTVDQQRHAPQANVFEQVAGTPTCSSSLQTDPSSRTLGAGALYLRPKLMQADVERINAHGITELITIRSGILKLISALEVVGLFLPQADQKAAALIAISTSSSTPKVSSTSLPHLVTGGGDEDDPSYFRDDLSSLVGRTRISILNAVPHGGGAGGGAHHHHHSGVAGGGGRVSFGGAFLTAVPYNTAGQLYSVLVTTIVANFVGLDTVRHATKQLPSTFSAIHTEYLRVVMDACTSHGGTVDLFYGDRIWAHFNAERRLPGHALKACRAILAIEDAIDAASLSRRFSASDRTSADTSTPWRDKRYSLRIRLGAATTEALCGVMGSCGVKRFTVVGACVRQAALLCASAGPKRIRHETSLPSDGIVGSRTPTAQDVLPFSSLLATKTVELARIRSVARNRSKQNVGNVAESPSHPSPTKKDSSKNTTGQEIVFRHVRMSAFMPNALHDQSVVSTPVLLSRILEEYPAHIVQSSPEVALQRMNVVNAVYEHVVAGNTAAANQLVGSLSFWDDEWLLRQIRQGISRN